MKRLAVLAALAVTACGPKPEVTAAITPPTPPAESPQPPSPAVTLDVLTADGIGPLRIGMTKDEVITAVGDTRTPDAVGIPGECIEFQPQRAPDGVWVMIESGKLTSITLGDLSTVKTDKGFGLGDTPDAVKAGYPDAKTTPHKYQDKPAEYITWWKGGPRNEPYVEDDAARGIVFEVDGTGRVGAIHAGGPSIQYVEGCA